jgi:hypothetical protein
VTNIYRLALQVQDASNISGVINSLNTVVMPAIREEQGYRDQGMPYLASHPALILFMDKIVSLMHVGFIHDVNNAISDAYSQCHDQAEVREAREREAKLEEAERLERDSILAERQAQRYAEGFRS